MTCVLASPWSHFNNSFSWSSMNPDPADSLSGLERATSHGYASSGSENRKVGSSGKKRASRAGTRSVSTLSAAQLERKRANDREAQRAIRQRTKDHIENLEKSITDLRQSHDANEKLILATRHRNRELEDENSYLRMKLNEAGLPIDLPAVQAQRSQDPAMLHASSPATQAPGVSIQRPASTSTSRSFSSTTAHSGTWQQQQAPRSGYNAPPSLPLAVPGTQAAQQPNLTTWRSHDSALPSVPGEIHTPAQAHPSIPYTTPTHGDRPQWAPAQYAYGVGEQQPTAQYAQTSTLPQHPPTQQTPAYTHAPVAAYQAGHPSQASAYQPAQVPPQSEFQNLSVSSPAGYQVPPGSQSYVPHAQYHMAPMQTAEYQQSHPAMQHPPMGNPQYQPAPTEQTYAQAAPLQYREDPSRGYPINHYPSG